MCNQKQNNEQSHNLLTFVNDLSHFLPLFSTSVRKIEEKVKGISLREYNFLLDRFYCNSMEEHVLTDLVCIDIIYKVASSWGA